MDALSLVAAFFNPDLWIVPILFQLSSGLAYTVYLLGTSIGLVKIGAIINTVLIAYLLAYQLSKQASSIREASDHEVVY
jgi:ATP sulfurylase